MREEDTILLNQAHTQSIVTKSNLEKERFPKQSKARKVKVVVNPTLQTKIRNLIVENHLVQKAIHKIRRAKAKKRNIKVKKEENQYHIVRVR